MDRMSSPKTSPMVAASDTSPISNLAGCGKTRGQTDLSTAWTHNLLIQHSRWGTDSSVPLFFRSLLGVLIAVGAVFALYGATGAPDAKRWWSHVLFLADDKLEGRETGSEGHRRAA